MWVIHVLFTPQNIAVTLPTSQHSLLGIFCNTEYVYNFITLVKYEL